MPKDASKFLGIYTTPTVAGVAFKIAYEKLPDGKESLALIQQGHGGGWLNFHDNRTAFLGNGGADMPANCFMEMASASVGSWITFDLGHDGSVLSLEMQDLYGVKFVKEVEHNRVNSDRLVV